MKSCFRIAVAGILTVTLAACDGKPKAPPGHQAAAALPATTTASNCPQATPSKDGIARALDFAMVQTYGAEESTAKFTVTAISPGPDCRHLNIAYRAGAAGGSAATGTLGYDDGTKWYLNFYGKRFTIP
jgi:hypothetical protein